MTEPAYSIVYSARLVGGTAIATGDVLIPSASAPGQYVIATSGNRGPRGSEGVALTAWSSSVIPGSVQMQQTGILDASISGLSDLGVDAAKQLVRTSTAGRMERVSSFTAGDDIIGYAEADGRVHLVFGIPWALIGGGGGGTPGGDDQQMQYNDVGAFGGIPDLIFDKNYYDTGSGAVIHGGKSVHEDEYATFPYGFGFARSQWIDGQTSNASATEIVDLAIPASDYPDCVIKLIVEGVYSFAGGGGEVSFKASFKREGGTQSRIKYKDYSDTDFSFGTVPVGAEAVSQNSDTIRIRATGIASTQIAWFMSIHLILEGIPS